MDVSCNQFQNLRNICRSVQRLLPRKYVMQATESLNVLTVSIASFLLQVPVTVHREQSVKRENQQVATIRCLLLTSVSTCFRHHYAHLQENKGPATAFGVLFWFCWMWLLAVVGRCVVGCEQRSHPTTQRPTEVGLITNI